MEKCTLESIYDLIINYYVKGYAINIGHHEYNSRHCNLLKLLLLRTYRNLYELEWDTSTNEDFRAWDKGIIIKKYI